MPTMIPPRLLNPRSNAPPDPNALFRVQPAIYGSAASGAHFLEQARRLPPPPRTTTPAARAPQYTRAHDVSVSAGPAGAGNVSTQVAPPLAPQDTAFDTQSVRSAVAPSIRSWYDRMEADSAERDVPQGVFPIPSAPPRFGVPAPSVEGNGSGSAEFHSMVSGSSGHSVNSDVWVSPNQHDVNFPTSLPPPIPVENLPKSFHVRFTSFSMQVDQLRVMSFLTAESLPLIQYGEAHDAELSEVYNSLNLKSSKNRGGGAMVTTQPFRPIICEGISFQISPVHDDGNTLWRCISKFIFCTEGHWELVRLPALHALSGSSQFLDVARAEWPQTTSMIEYLKALSRARSKRAVRAGYIELRELHGMLFTFPVDIYVRKLGGAVSKELAFEGFPHPEYGDLRKLSLIFDQETMTWSLLLSHTPTPTISTAASLFRPAVVQPDGEPTDVSSSSSSDESDDSHKKKQARRDSERRARKEAKANLRRKEEKKQRKRDEKKEKRKRSVSIDRSTSPDTPRDKRKRSVSHDRSASPRSRLPKNIAVRGADFVVSQWNLPKKFALDSFERLDTLLEELELNLGASYPNFSLGYKLASKVIRTSLHKSIAFSSLSLDARDSYEFVATELSEDEIAVQNRVFPTLLLAAPQHIRKRLKAIAKYGFQDCFKEACMDDADDLFSVSEVQSEGSDDVPPASIRSIEGFLLVCRLTLWSNLEPQRDAIESALTNASHYKTLKHDEVEARVESWFRMCKLAIKFGVTLPTASKL